jgi:hypothetical protein
MIYLLFALNIITLALLVLLHRSSRRELAVERDAARSREDQLLNRIQAPQQAAIQSMTKQAGPLEPGHVSAFDDEAMAEYESRRSQLMVDTRALIEQYDSSLEQEPAAA